MNLIKRTFRYILTFFPKANSDYLMYRILGKRVDWNKPRDLNEWIRWLLVNTDTSEWSKLADKYMVREYVKDKGLENILVPLYGVYSSADEIDYSTLPDQFVMKVNHGCGDVVVCKSKKQKDELASSDELRVRFNKLLRSKYGRESGESHYLKINPKIIIEKYLDNEEQRVESSSLVDYKFWCINGRVESCFVVLNRKNGFYGEISLFDREWNCIPEYLKDTEHFHVVSSPPILQPSDLQEMFKVCEILAKGFPQVRVDLYEVGGRIYFGELTFSSQGGLMTYFTDEYLKILGNKISTESHLLEKD